MKPVAYSPFASMSERRITYIMNQSTGGRYSTDILNPVQFNPFIFGEPRCNCVPKISGDSRYLQRMGQSGPHGVMWLQWKYLRLILQTAHRSRKYGSVVISFEFLPQFCF